MGLISELGIRRMWLKAEGCAHPLGGTAMYPGAVYDPTSNKTFITFEGWSGAVREARVITYNHGSKTVDGSVNTGVTTLVNDSHGAPHLMLSDSGHIFVQGMSHNTPMRTVSSNNSRDIQSWTVQPTFGTATTYPHMALIDGVLYSIFRGDNDNRYGSIVKSTSIVGGTVTWGGAGRLMDAGANTRYYGGPLLVIGTEIYQPFTISPDPYDRRLSLYCMVYDTATGNVRNLDGSVVVLDANRPATNMNDFLLYQQGAGRDGKIPSICQSSNGDIHFATGDGSLASQNDYDGMHFIWDGSTLSGPELVGNTTRRTVNQLIVPWGDDVAMFYANSTIPGRLGGDVKVRKKVSGVWQAEETLRQDVTGHALSSPAPVHNSTPELRVLFTELTQTEATEDGALKLYGYGENGFCTVPTNSDDAVVIQLLALTDGGFALTDGSSALVMGV